MEKTAWLKPDADLEGEGAGLEPRYATKRFQLEHHLVEPTGTWVGGARLLVTATAQPALLGLPLAVSALGWAGGITVLVLGGCYTLYCNLLLASLHDYGGTRQRQYRQLARNIMGERHPFAFHLIIIPQYTIIIGLGVANLVLASDNLQAICSLYHTDCPLANYQWTIVVAAALMLLAQCPDMGSSGLLTGLSSFFVVFYSTAAIALSAVQGGGRGAEYSLLGSEVNQVMNAFNAVGIIVFTYTVPIIPEIQATLAADRATQSTYPPMRRALLSAFVVIGAVYLGVAVVGYWAWGNSVSGFVLAMSTHPTWLLIVTNLMSVSQLLVAEQVCEYVLYETGELALVARFPQATWLHKQRLNSQGRRVQVPSRLAMLLVRVPYIAVITTIAATFPFFTQIMGLVGALGLTPLCLVLPPVLYVMARGRGGGGGSSKGEKGSTGLSPLAYWANVSAAVVWAGVGLLAAIGSVRAIVVAIEAHDFYS